MKLKILFLLLILPFTNLKSQQLPPIRFETQAPNCNLREKMYDNPISYNHGWYMPRYQWHILYAGASLGLSEGLHKITKLPRKVTAPISVFAVGSVPHLLGGIVKRQYPINYPDWIFDLNDRALPLYLLQDNKWMGLGEFSIVYLATYCYASP